LEKLKLAFSKYLLQYKRKFSFLDMQHCKNNAMALYNTPVFWSRSRIILVDPEPQRDAAPVPLTPALKGITNVTVFTSPTHVYIQFKS
jgi:hypothetical protein